MAGPAYATPVPSLSDKLAFNAGPPDGSHGRVILVHDSSNTFCDHLFAVKEHLRKAAEMSFHFKKYKVSPDDVGHMAWQGKKITRVLNGFTCFSN